MSSFPTPPQAPATGSSAYAPPSQWPTTIGAISIVYGALGGILALYGLVSSVLLGAGSAPGVPQGFEVPSEVKAFSVLDAFFGLLFAAMLILGGIAVIRRRGGGVKLLRSYAIARLVLLVPLAVGAGWAGSVTAKAMFETIEQQSQPDTAEDGQSQPNQSGPEASGAGEESGMGEAVSADGMTVTSKDGNIEVVGGTVESTDNGTTVITNSGGGRVVITTSGDGDSSSVVVTRGGSKDDAKAVGSRSKKQTPEEANAEAVKMMKPFMGALLVGSTACSALLAAIWPIVLLVVLSNAQRKAEASAWASGL